MKFSVKVSPLNIDLLRRVGIGVAMSELAYLAYWMSRDLGLLAPAAFVRASTGGRDALAQLVGGMIMAAAIGATCGLVTAIAVRIAGKPAAIPVRLSPDHSSSGTRPGRPQGR